MGLLSWLARLLGFAQPGDNEEIRPWISLPPEIEAPTQPDLPPAQAPIPAASGSAFVPSVDAWESDYVISEEEQYAVDLPAWVHYRDSKGQDSRREIAVRRIAKREDGSFVLLAFCQVRKANRSFVVSRIEQFIDLTTGEVVPDVGPHLMACYWASPAGQLAGLWDRRAAELRALLFVAKADGALRIQQRALILAYLQRIEPSLVAGDDHLKEALSGWEINQRQFRADLKTVAALEVEIGAALLAALEGLAATRKSKRDFTDAAMVVARKALKSSQARA